jgi:hypothetical protein
VCSHNRLHYGQRMSPCPARQAMSASSSMISKVLASCLRLMPLRQGDECVPAQNAGDRRFMGHTLTCATSSMAHRNNRRLGLVSRHGFPSWLHALDQLARGHTEHSMPACLPVSAFCLSCHIYMEFVAVRLIHAHSVPWSRCTCDPDTKCRATFGPMVMGALALRLM